MQKVISVLAVIIIILAAIALSSCRDSGGDEALVGTWNWDVNSAYQYIFNEDGTGSRGFAVDRIPFNWSASDGVLRIGTERWNYIIEDDVLTIDSRQVAGLTLRYIRQ